MKVWYNLNDNFEFWNKIMVNNHIKAIKDFDKWNKKKKEINYSIQNILPKIREVWWLSIGLNVGVEEDGKNNNFKRPVLVIKVFNRQCFFRNSNYKCGQKQ